LVQPELLKIPERSPQRSQRRRIAVVITVGSVLDGSTVSKEESSDSDRSAVAIRGYRTDGRDQRHETSREEVGTAVVGLDAGIVAGTATALRADVETTGRCSAAVAAGLSPDAKSELEDQHSYKPTCLSHYFTQLISHRKLGRCSQSFRYLGMVEFL